MPIKLTIIASLFFKVWVVLSTHFPLIFQPSRAFQPEFHRTKGLRWDIATSGNVSESSHSLNSDTPSTNFLFMSSSRKKESNVPRTLNSAEESRTIIFVGYRTCTARHARVSPSDSTTCQVLCKG